MLKMPDSAGQTSEGLAGYISKNFSDQNEKAAAIFYWISNNIGYDPDKINNINIYQNSGDLVKEVLKTRKGVCMHYAELFCEVASKTGLKAYIVTGYTRQNGTVVYLPHAWCAVLIDSSWCLFDPTWGSGYIRDSKFVRKFNDFYFRTDPEKLIGSHMPFDPMWQLLDHPVTNKEFYEGKSQINKTGTAFNYNDSLKKYESQSPVERLIASNRRIEENGVVNRMISDMLQHNRNDIEYYQTKQTVDQYNLAVAEFNRGITKLNAFIDYRNRQFNPVKPDSEIRKMMEETEQALLSTLENLDRIKNPDPVNASSAAKLREATNEALGEVKEQNKFLDKYFRTGKLFRKTLFYTTTIKKVPAK